MLKTNQQKFINFLHQETNIFTFASLFVPESSTYCTLYMLVFWVLPNNPIFCTVRCDMWGRKSWRCRPCLLTMKTLAPQLCCEFHPDLSRDLVGHLLPVPCRIQNVLRIMPMPWYQGRLGQCCFFCHRPHRIFTLSSLGVTVKEIDRGKFPGRHDLFSCHPDQAQKRLRWHYVRRR